jgi:D-alanyl-D-alanine carboxypeptidase/D-alanyl-D-alanine-endopeptidase (penicillin-binding protein 4)
MIIPNLAVAQTPGTLSNLIGKNDAVMVTDNLGNVVLSKNSRKQLIPASTLKILTSLVAMHYLGPDYRFVTEFYLDDNGDLTVKGHGDPLIISEVLMEIASTLAQTVPRVRHILMDDSHFADPLTIPGVTTTSNPYDAPNGALCVNFNTVSFRRKKGVFVSGEEQTPLLPFAIEKIEKSGKSRGRITLSHHRRDITMYAGLLLQYFLEDSGILVTGSVKPAGEQPPHGHLIYTYRSVFTVAEVVEKLLKSSSNFMTNQLLIASGVKAYGPPGNLVKGVRAALSYASDVLGLQDIRITEGSGISRGNRLSAAEMMVVLEAFEPFRHLLRRKDRDQFKTGSLNGVRTRAGYIESRSGEHYRYSIIFNTKGRSTDTVVTYLLKNLK